jgi:zinc D-Ala-D-Ala carboxypeptidase
MNYSRFNKRKKKKNYTWVIISVVVVLLLVAAITVYVLDDEQKVTEESNTDEQQLQQPTKNTSDIEHVQAEQPKVKEPQVDEGGYAIMTTTVTEPTIIEGILIANKKYPLPTSYNPGEDPEALAAYKEMEAAAKTAGFNITAFSGFRSYEYQTTLYENYKARDGKENADRYSARPGHSEHQTGLAFDIGELGREDLWLTAEFGETPAGQWLVQNAHTYGFILRYPKGKEDVTGFMYESWHFRYVGKDVAKKVNESGVTLEEYLGID